VTHLRKRMLEELQRRNYSEGTTRAYLHAVEQFAVHFGRSPDKLGPDDLRSYQAYLWSSASWQWEAWWLALRRFASSSFAH
jgi:integrase/recombinase XerD